MHARALLTLQLALLAAAADAQLQDNGLRIRKCCDIYEMLSGDGRTCVDADWPRKVTYEKPGIPNTLISPVDSQWVPRWLPPGIPLQKISSVLAKKIRPIYTHAISVNASSVWDPAHPLAEKLWRKQFALTRDSYLARLKPGGAIMRTYNYCVDAARPPLGPFALLFRTRCTEHECAWKCCENGEMLVNEKGAFECKNDSRGYWNPTTTSFTEEFESELPFHKRVECSQFHLHIPENRLVYFPRTWAYQRYFSTSEFCVDYHANSNGSLKEDFFYCEFPRVARGVYWLLRYLCPVSTFLLAASLASIASDIRMRRKEHGWCLASHAACLLAFSMGQLLYYPTMSERIDDDTYINNTAHRWRIIRSNTIIPGDLQCICRHFALWMYFLLMAAWCWLTALCVNMVMDFRLQVARSRRGRRKRFFALSAFAWGLPTILTTVCAWMFNHDPRQGIPSSQSFLPSLLETRVCYKEPLTQDKETLAYQRFHSDKSGTSLFYYGPVGCLLLCNCVCLAITLRKVQNLRRGNSILRREEEQRALRHRRSEADNPPTTHSVRSDRSTGESGNGDGSGSAVDVKTIKLYLKLFLTTGGIELITEIIIWSTIHYSTIERYSQTDYHYFYRAAGYATDFFRAACVAWMAAPEGGYTGPILRRMRGEKEESRTTRP